MVFMYLFVIAYAQKPPSSPEVSNKAKEVNFGLSLHLHVYTGLDKQNFSA